MVQVQQRLRLSGLGHVSLTPAAYNAPRVRPAASKAADCTSHRSEESWTGQKQHRVQLRAAVPTTGRSGRARRTLGRSRGSWIASCRTWPLTNGCWRSPNARRFPQVMNKTLNFIAQLNGKDAFGRPGTIAIVKVPRALPRVIPLPSKLTPDRQAFVLLSSVIRAHLADLFPRRGVAGFSQFRVTRDSELWVDEREVSDLRQALQIELTQRHFGNAVRLEVLRTCPEALELMLREQFELPPHAVYRVAGPVNLVRLNQLVDHLNRPEHRFPPLVPAWPRQLAQGSDLFEAIRQGDILLHHPFESFEPVVDFLRQAVADPKVVAIRMTLYRTGTGSILVDLLVEAARLGKEVTVVVELKARFDEEANINVAERLEAVGAQIVYGLG